MTNQVHQLAGGAMQAVGEDVTKKVLQNPQCQQALQCTADTVVATGAAVVGTVAAAGQAATAVGTAVVAGGSLVVAAAAPIVAIGAVVYGGYKFWEWLNS